MSQNAKPSWEKEGDLTQSYDKWKENKYEFNWLTGVNLATKPKGMV